MCHRVKYLWNVIVKYTIVKVYQILVFMWNYCMMDKMWGEGAKINH